MNNKRLINLDTHPEWTGCFIDNEGHLVTPYGALKLEDVETLMKSQGYAQKVSARVKLLEKELDENLVRSTTQIQIQMEAARTILENIESSLINRM